MKNKPTAKDRAALLGERLRAAREDAGLTQQELAKILAVSYPSICRYERGLVMPSWEMVLRLADALGVDVTEFDPKKT